MEEVLDNLHEMMGSVLEVHRGLWPRLLNCCSNVLPPSCLAYPFSCEISDTDMVPYEFLHFPSRLACEYMIFVVTLPNEIAE